MGLIAEKADPNDFGFDVSVTTLRDIQRNLKYRWVLQHNLHWWKEIQNRLAQDYKFWSGVDSIGWILDIDMDRINESGSKRFLTSLRSVKHRIRDAIPRPARRNLRSIQSWIKRRSVH